MDWTGWTILAGAIALFGLYSIGVFLLGLMFAGRFRVQITEEVDDAVS